MSKIRLLLVDDHPLVRTGLRTVLNAELDMEVLGEAVDGPTAIQRALELEPDVVIMDITMGGMSGLSATREIRKQLPDTRVLALTMHEDPEYVRQMLDAGASGYVIKKATSTELAVAIRAVHRGELYIHSSLAATLLGHVITAPTGSSRQTGIEKLSDREKQVLRLVAQGYSSRQIAEKLFLSVRTVDTYRARLIEKLDLHSRVALFRFAQDNGLLDEGSEEPSS
jgi:two-component system response regulator NreC